MKRVLLKKHKKNANFKLSHRLILIYLNLSLPLFNISSKILFNDFIYNGIPMARKKYSFLIIVMSSKIMYKLGRISNNDIKTPAYGFVITFFESEINFNMGKCVFDTVMIILVLFCSSNVLSFSLLVISIVMKAIFTVMKFRFWL